MKRIQMIASATAALALRARPARAQARKPLPIRVGISNIESYAEALYAQSQGFFAAAGLDAQPLTLPGGGAPMTMAVISGSLDAAIANIGSIASAHVRGLGIDLIAPCGLYASAIPTSVLAVLKTSPLRSAAELEGKTVGVTSLGDLQHAALLQWLDANGVSAKAVTLVEIATPQMLVALSANRIAAGMVVEPALTSFKNDIRVLGVPYDSVATSLLISGWIVNRGWYEANPDAAARLLTAIRTTARWANRNQAATGAILADHTKIAPELLASMHRVPYAEERNFATMQPVIDVMAKFRLIPQSFHAGELFPAALRHEGPI